MNRDRIAIALATVAIIAGVWFMSQPADALPVSGMPQYAEKVGPCASLDFSTAGAVDGGVCYAESAEGVDGGTNYKLGAPGTRYRVWSSGNAYLGFGAEPTTSNGIPLTAEAAEEMSFDYPNATPGRLCGIGASSAVAVKLCQVNTYRSRQ